MESLIDVYARFPRLHKHLLDDRDERVSVLYDSLQPLLAVFQMLNDSLVAKFGQYLFSLIMDLLFVALDVAHDVVTHSVQFYLRILKVPQ